ncbi:MAG: tetratricopeptide repeat protein [Saprospiraceae bacterium]
MKYILFSFIGLLSFAVNAQEKMSWRQHQKLANNFLKQGQYAEAGENYLLAWKQKTKKKNLAYQAGKAFLQIKDYRKAAEAFAHIKKELKDFPLIGLEYGRCLKQDGQYQAASDALVYFINAYQRKDRALIAQIVQTEVKGCEQAIKALAEDPHAATVELALLGENINTPAAEFAPMSFSDDVLYFTSTSEKQVKIYRTQLQDGNWIKATAPSSFPKITEANYGNGTLSPDHKRFYFTICKEEKNWEGVYAKCEIFVTQRKNDQWTTPERLRDYINMKRSNTTHPFVTQVGNKEILYFSSDREGGEGGMDIWCTSRNISSNAFDFSFPENLTKINTIGDEITPSYDTTEGFLYFSSNGLVSFGGFDIFRATGKAAHIGSPENMGLPINSPADDYYYIRKVSGQGGYLSSNRLFGLEKITTTQEDLFSFSAPSKSFLASGKILDKKTQAPVKGVALRLYEKLSDGRKRLLTQKNFDDGQYELALLPHKSLSLAWTKEGFLSDSFDFQTGDPATAKTLIHDIILEQKSTQQSAIVSLSKPVFAPNTTTSPPVTTSSKQAITSRYTTQDTKTSTELRNTSFSTGTTSAHANSLPSQRTSSDQAATNPSLGVQKIKPNQSTTPIATKTNTNTTIDRSRATIVSNPTSYTMEPRDGIAVKTSAPRHEGIYYKVQIIAVGKYSERHNRYNSIRHLGRLDTELIIEKGWTRVLLADYYSVEEARKVALEARQQDQFFEAYVVRYKNGRRMGRAK